MLQDFVRWHSEKDWLVSEHSGPAPKDSSFADEQPDGSWVYKDESSAKLVRGSMSTRMSGGDKHENIWTQKWEEARPVPVSRQKPLVDHVREGERILHLLETIDPQSLIRQCALVALSALHHMFSSLPSAQVMHLPLLLAI
jgi:Rab3 GTPase-activating protein catalytic subunit